jgi:NADPH:quinone reductase-like Zn-dependent oxidoreductase
MKAVVHESYGPPEVLKIVEIEKPEVPEDGVLVRVHASSVNIVQWYGMTGLFLARLGGGLLRPKDTRLGADFAGVVEAVGKSIAAFKPGDEVFGGVHGAFAEYVTVRKGIAPKPANMTFEEAAAVPTAGLTALQGLRDYGKIQPGQKVLINGASGGVGTFAVQIAKAFGAHVTAVCSTRNIECARFLGADQVIDYTREDFTRSGARYDLFFDVVGSRSWFGSRRVLKADATVVLVGGPRTPVIGPLGHILGMQLGSRGSGRKVVFFIAKFTPEDLHVLKDLMEAGKLKPFVEKIYPMTQIGKAMRYLGTGHVQGKLVLTMR